MDESQMLADLCTDGPMTLSRETIEASSKLLLMSLEKLQKSLSWPRSHGYSHANPSCPASTVSIKHNMSSKSSFENLWAIALGLSLAATRSLVAAGPCDIYDAGGSPCVAAHSTTRALYSAYSGNLYQVKRAKDSATTNITPLTAGGTANAATQDSFCSGTTCTITIIYDQSGKGNHLTQVRITKFKKSSLSSN
jgi:hypothetical protein